MVGFFELFPSSTHVPGLPLLFLYLHLLSLNKDDHFLITSYFHLLLGSLFDVTSTNQ